MAYDIVIGQGVIRTDDDEIGPQMVVEEIILKDAPCFPNDPTGQSNIRRPAYSVWSNFCKETGLTNWFFTPDGGVRGGHPGNFMITPMDIAVVSLALEKYKTTTIEEPGFNESWERRGPISYNGNLARLIWLDWWMRWAIQNCTNPILTNN